MSLNASLLIKYRIFFDVLQNYQAIRRMRMQLWFSVRYGNQRGNEKSLSIEKYELKFVIECSLKYL